MPLVRLYQPDHDWGPTPPLSADFASLPTVVTAVRSPADGRLFVPDDDVVKRYDAGQVVKVLAL